MDRNAGLAVRPTARWAGFVAAAFCGLAVAPRRAHVEAGTEARFVLASEAWWAGQRPAANVPALVLQTEDCACATGRRSVGWRTRRALGEQGRGSAVVASEVRALAQRSAEAAREIKSLIQLSTGKVESEAALVGQAGQTMGELVGAVRRVSQQVAAIPAV